MKHRIYLLVALAVSSIGLASAQTTTTPSSPPKTQTPAQQPPAQPNPPAAKPVRPASPTAPATPPSSQPDCSAKTGLEKAECERRDTSRDDLPAGVTSSQPNKPK